MSYWKTLLLIGSLCLLAACGKMGPAPVDARDLPPFAEGALCAWHTGDPEAGREIFERPVLAGTGGCTTCHSLEPNVRLVGPSLYGVAATASARHESITPPNYLYLSIMAPNQFVVDGFPAGIMPDNYATELSEEEVTNLVTFLMTQNPVE
ncbi:MAG: c-type cytochrome [Caldilineaceae bacterium]|nr:c-type cytochrome [Caldilineaceae bacterium]HRJ41897.1 cytochrome c [Caldilineaceae bacterium]